MKKNDYSFLSGLKQLSQDLKGTETVGIGIRPFGFHAGNMCSIVAYPILLCEYMQQLQKPVRFEIHCWFNDVEQHKIIGHPKGSEKGDEANIYPAGKTIQFTPAFDGHEESMTDYWQPLIEYWVLEIKKLFPEVNIYFHRASNLNRTKEFKSAVIQAIQKSSLVSDIIEQELCKQVYRPAEYVRAVCPLCKHPIENNTLTTNQLVRACCTKCDVVHEKDVSSFDWWIHHRILTLPKLASIPTGYDIWMMGADHLNEKETPVRNRLAAEFGFYEQDYIAVHAPIIESPMDTWKISKSNGNIVYVPLQDLLDRLRHENGQRVRIDDLPHSLDVMTTTPEYLKEKIRKAV